MGIRSPRRFDLHLFLLVVFLVVINIPYWDPQFLVGGDTKNAYLIFHYFYNHLVWYNELPQWFPYGLYGYSPLFFHLCNDSPCSYLVEFVGWLLRVKDTLLLFKLAAFGDQLVFLLGLHLLSRLLYRHRATCFLICLLGIGSVVWIWQIYWCLRLFYLLPLALYFYYRFFTERISWTFWATLLTLLFVLAGGLPYWAPIYFFLFLVMTLIMLPGNWRAFGALKRPGWRDFLLAFVFALSAVAFGYLLTTCLNGLHNYTVGRAEEGMHTDLRTFLVYINGVWQNLHSFLDGTLPNLALKTGEPDDLSLYVGLLPVGTLLFAMFHVRDRRFQSLFGGLIAILLLAGSGMSSWVFYWTMPGMKLFRHLGLLLELAKVLLLLSAGFGLDLLLSRIEKRGWLVKHFRLFTLLTLLAGLCIILDMVVSTMAYDSASWDANEPMHLLKMLPKGGEWIAVRLAVWGAALTGIFLCVRLPALRKQLSPQVVIGILAVACLVDVGTFQCYQWQNRSHGKYAGRLELEPLKYSATRSWMFNRPEIQHMNSVIASSPGGSYHSFYANILQYDSCSPTGRVDIVSAGVHELVTARGANPDIGRGIASTFLPLSDSQLMTVMGCNAPKVRFVSQAEYGRTDQEIDHLVRSSTNLDATVILRGGSGHQPSATKIADLYPMTYRTAFFNANRLDLDVSVKPGLPGWLVYSDAYNPNWKAYVNGKEMPVLEAYGAFKAVNIEGGESRVSFRYENRWQKYAVELLRLVGILLAVGCIFGLVWRLFNCKADPSAS